MKISSPTFPRKTTKVTKANPFEDEPALTGSRLVTLRHLEGLTQTDLASQLGVSQGFLSQAEKGVKPLPVDVAHAAASRYDLPIEFFSVRQDVSELGAATFRKSSTASVRDENLVVASFTEAARLFRLASQRSGYKPADFDGALSDDVEETAANVRSMLGVGSTEAVANATRAAERLGVGVIHGLVPLEEHSGMHDGVSRPSPLADRPLIATVGLQPPAVTRLTLMHELGHILYDRHRTTPIRGTRSPEERRAFQFGGAMLVPASVMRERVTETLTLHGYLRVKADYGISVSALIVRACALGIISAQRKRSLFIQLSSQGWRRTEPVPVAAETPLLIRQATERGLGSDVHAVARVTGIRYRQIEQWTGLRATERRLAPVVALKS